MGFYYYFFSVSQLQIYFVAYKVTFSMNINCVGSCRIPSIFYVFTDVKTYPTMI